ncbi:DcrB-related protein [Actinosynnema sp. NPDC023658]|uniref:DcrB-related protein n=1 Tax=Actinosynnema sp. NPDC023658 TaxID=3155465 RepID=UPI0033C335C3
MIEGDDMLHAGISGVMMPVLPGWEDLSQITVAAVRDGFRHNLVLTVRELCGRTVKAFIDDHIANLYGTLADFMMNLEESVAFGRHDGRLIDYEFTSNGDAFRQRQFFVFRGERVYNFTYTDLLGQFEANMTIMEQIIGSTRFAEDGPSNDRFEV